MAAASLEEMYPGRVILCLGVGAPADLKAAGIDSPRPIKTLARGDRDLPLAAGRRDDRFPGRGLPRLRPAPGQRRAQRADRAGGLASQHAEARRPRDRRRADLGRDLAALREGLPRAGRVRGGRPAVPQARHRLHQARRHGEARHRSDPPADRLRAARRPSCREHPPVRRQPRPGRAGGGLCRRGLARSRPPGERRRRAPPRRLRHACPGESAARGISRLRPRRGDHRRRRRRAIDHGGAGGGPGRGKGEGS